MTPQQIAETPQIVNEEITPIATQTHEIVSEEIPAIAPQPLTQKQARATKNPRKIQACEESETNA